MEKNIKTQHMIYVPKAIIKKSSENGFCGKVEFLENENVKKEYPNLIVHKNEEEDSKNRYFASYAHYGIHEEMLKDKIRTGTYRKAILMNKHLFKDKIVLDIGAGTGVLSIFAAQAGAEHVFSVECSDIAWSCCQIIEENGYQDKITVIKGKLEEITLPVEKVDIIISEWMGYFLLYESMLDSIIFARDHFLKEGGLIFPDKAKLFVAAIEDGKYKQNKVEFWNDVYGINMGCMKNSVITEPMVDVIDKAAIVTNVDTIFEIDIQKVTVEELNFNSNFNLTFKYKESAHGLIAWFETRFSYSHTPIILTTSPFCDPTHWKQTIFYMNKPVIGNIGEILTGNINVRKNQINHRELDIDISYEFAGQNHQYKDLINYTMQ